LGAFPRTGFFSLPYVRSLKRTAKDIISLICVILIVNGYFDISHFLFDVSYFFFSWFSPFRPKDYFCFARRFPADGIFSLLYVRSLKRTAKEIIASISIYYHFFKILKNSIRRLFFAVCFS